MERSLPGTALDLRNGGAVPMQMSIPFGMSRVCKMYFTVFEYLFKTVHIPFISGIILEAVIEGMAAYYSEQLSQNVRRGMRATAQKAQYTGGSCPLGYTIDENKKYVVDPKHAPTVKLIYEMYAEGKTVTEIVNELNSRGIRNSKGKPFTFNSLNKVLKNKKYIGIYSYNKEVIIENAIPPILDTELFYKVQEMLYQNQKAAAHRKAKVDYLLFGKLFCGKCGTMMVGVCGTSKTGARHHYYLCPTQKKKLCKKKAVRQHWIENLVLEQAAKLLQDHASSPERPGPKNRPGSGRY